MNELETLHDDMIKKRRILDMAKIKYYQQSIYSIEISDILLKAFRDDINATKAFNDLLYETINTESFISNAYYRRLSTIEFIMKYT